VLTFVIRQSEAASRTPGSPAALGRRRPQGGA
jgi:hypothetical protein